MMLVMYSSAVSWEGEGLKLVSIHRIGVSFNICNQQKVSELIVNYEASFVHIYPYLTNTPPSAPPLYTNMDEK